MVLQQLDALRGEMPKCDFLALADIASGTILCVSSDQKIPQEQLDVYCVAAAEMLDSGLAQAVSGVLGQAEDAHLRLATVLSGRQTVFFLRSTQDPNEALLCRCVGAPDVDRILPLLHSGLAKIAATPWTFK